MVEFCYCCQKKHSDTNWRSLTIDNKTNWICSRWFKTTSVEFVPQSLKDERAKNVKSMLQPWRQGEPSAEFIEAYPKIAKKMFTPKERLTARNVWKDIPNIKNWRKTK